METPHLFSHPEAEQMLQRVGYSQEQIDDLLRQLPDPIDTDRDGPTLLRLAITASQLADRMGGSP